MNWIRINITCEKDCPATFSEEIANLLIISGVDTFTTDDFSDLEETLSQGGIFYDYIADDLLSLQSSTPVVHAFLTPDDEGEEICTAVYKALEELKSINSEYSSLKWDRDSVRDEDWENNWKEFFKPFPVGDKLYVKPTWEELGEDANGRYIIEIDPSSSFGTGTHATTKLCLERLEKIPTENTHVLDMGCGSGILSIGALLLGAESVVAVDIDEVASRIASENLENNGFNSERATVLCGNALEDEALVKTIGEGYDVICANIVAGIIIEMSPLFMSALKNGGYLIASGIISERENEVRLALEKIGFKVVETASEDDWSVILAQKI
ncbi:MAG: 50S ribosomal protein L11 methyltransferase [Clostridia bacterium]|nr:50S ribosomal protein L11 methyltransferase [Clostridia bacterium]